MSNITEDRQEILAHLQAIQRVLSHHTYVDTLEGATLTLKRGSGIKTLLQGSGALSHTHYDGYESTTVYGLTIRWPTDPVDAP